MICLLSGYHRCYGDTGVLIGALVELSVGLLCMRDYPLVVSGCCSVNRTKVWCDGIDVPESATTGAAPGIKLSTYRINDSPREHLLSSTDGRDSHPAAVAPAGHLEWLGEHKFVILFLVCSFSSLFFLSFDSLSMELPLS
jgi:hypothetical protein